MIYPPGSTSKSIDVQIVDDNGLPLTGLVAATFPPAYYSVAGNTASTLMSLSDLAAITTPYTSGGVKERAGSAGIYRLDVPDAALASTGDVTIYGDGANKHLVAKSITVATLSVNLAQILGTALTETSGGQLAAAFKKLFDVASPVLTTASVNQTGDSYARLGAPAGASHAADIAAVKTDTAAIKAKTDNLPASPAATSDIPTANITAIKAKTDQLAFTVANQVDVNVIDWKSATAPAMTGDAYARLGTPSTGTVSGDIAAVKSDTGSLVSRITSTLFTGITSLAQWLGAMAGKQTPDATAKVEMHATGAGSGNFDPTTDALEALRDRGDAAWITATGFAVPGSLMGLTTGAITSAKFATDAISGTAVAASAVTKIQSGLATSSALTTVGTGVSDIQSRIPAALTADGNIKADALKFDGQSPVQTTGKLWVLDSSGNTVANEADLTSVKAKTDQLAFTTPNQVDANVIDKTGFALTSDYDAAKTAAQASDVPTPVENADALLNRDMSAVSDTNDRTPLNSLRFLRNRWDISGSTMTVRKEDDATAAWMATLSTNPSAQPIVGSDPAGP